MLVLLLYYVITVHTRRSLYKFQPSRTTHSTTLKILLLKTIILKCMYLCINVLNIKSLIHIA